MTKASGMRSTSRRLLLFRSRFKSAIYFFLPGRVHPVNEVLNGNEVDVFAARLANSL
jgi:hypothetical protein